MDRRPINFAEKFSKFSDHWAPKIIAQMNDYHFKLVKIQGEFVWHSHADTDEVFIVIGEEMKIHLRNNEQFSGAEVNIAILEMDLHLTTDVAINFVVVSVSVTDKITLNPYELDMLCDHWRDYH